VRAVGARRRRRRVGGAARAAMPARIREHGQQLDERLF